MIAIPDISPFSVILFERAADIFYWNCHYAFINDAKAIAKAVASVIMNDIEEDTTNDQT